MRKVRISDEAVAIPNAIRIGYGKMMAQPGDFIIYKHRDSSEERARVLGKIVEIQEDGLEDCTGWLLVVTLAQDLSFAYFRWVRPDWVITCTASQRVVEVLKFFMSSSPMRLMEGMVKSWGENPLMDNLEFERDKENFCPICGDKRCDCTCGAHGTQED